MNPKLNDNFKLFCDFLGIGDINSKIWFIGIEEGGNITSNNINEQLNICKKITDYKSEAVENTQVWDIISELLFEKFSDVHKLSRTDYRKKMFNENYSYFFLTELFPLPKPKLSTWPKQYADLFGFGQSDYYEYISAVRSRRFPPIYRNWIEKKPNLTICFGISYRYEFINLLQLGHIQFECLHGDRILYYPGENVLLCPFFNSRYFKDDDKMVVKELIDKTRCVK